MATERGRWQRYWYRAGGMHSAAILRIAIATSILLTLWRLHGGHAGSPGSAPHDKYVALGILRLIPGEPGPAVFAILWPVAWAATLAMLLGIRSRTATVVSFISALVLASYAHSFQRTWSHDNNAPLLAQLAFLGAHGGDAWSCDAWWRRRREQALPDGHAYLWSVLLVQLVLGLMMASAAYTKLMAGGTSLAWVLSDNLRNHILVRFDLKGVPQTDLASWLIESPTRWKLAAALNIIAQLAPLAACFATRRPVLRALLGSLFVIETIGLDVVMGFPNYHWLPLAAVFVDWDWLASRLRSESARQPREPERGVPVRRAVRIFIAAFVLVDGVIVFYRWPMLDQRIGAYPLSAFPMFAQIRARPPYGEHTLYETFESRFAVVSDAPLEPAVQAWIEGHPAGRGLENLRSPDAAREVLTAFASELRREHPQLVVRTVGVRLVAVQFPPYPAPPQLARAEVATIAELASDGLRCMLGRVEPTGATPMPVGLPLGGRIGLYRDGAVGDLAPGSELPRRVHVVVRVLVPGEAERLFVVGARS